MARIQAVRKKETLAQLAYDSLRKGIRESALEHGRVYSESELAAEMEISRTPVREALIELAREGLVEVLPQRGFRLRVLSDAERQEVFDLRLSLEGLVVERLARRSSPTDVKELRRYIQRQEANSSNATAFLVIDEDFHLAMPGLLELERTSSMLRSLRGAMWLMGALAMSATERAPRVIAEHRDIVDAIEEGDARAARRALKAHLESTVLAAEVSH